MKLGDLVLARIVDGTVYRGSMDGKPEYESLIGSEGKDSLTNASHQERRHVWSSSSRRYLVRDQDSPKSYS